MLNNPDLITGLIGFDGFLAIALTAVVTRLFADEARAAKLEAAKDAVFQKVATLESGFKYLQGRLEMLAEIVSDGSITPAEVETVTSEVESIKNKIVEIMNRGGDAE